MGQVANYTNVLCFLQQPGEQRNRENTTGYCTSWTTATPALTAISSGKDSVPSSFCLSELIFSLSYHVCAFANVPSHMLVPLEVTMRT